MSAGTWLALGQPDLGERLRLARDRRRSTSAA
jgi:hypothetical protein